MMESQFRTHGVDISILPNGGGVVGSSAVRQYTPIAEGVFSVRMDVLGVHGEGQCFGQFDIYTQGGVDQRKRSDTHLCAYVCALARFKIRSTRREIDIAGCTELTGRLEDIGFLPVEEVDLLHVIQRETA